MPGARYGVEDVIVSASYLLPGDGVFAGRRDLG